MRTQTFTNLSQDKQRTVVNAALFCFGKNGYKKTAMSEIAAEAGVSKAALFHYFGSKKELYVYLFRFSCQEILARMGSGRGHFSEDFFTCLQIGAQIKLAVMKDHPGMFDFLFSLRQEEDPALLEDLGKIQSDGVEKGIEMLFSRVNWDRFRPEIGIQEAISLVTWISDGYIKTHAAGKDMNQMVSELTGYLNLLKRTLYKEAYL